jgi:NADPH:quinone reductase-like Zn-dependent oxidoreductase
MTVIGSTGGAKKCAFVRELGADAVIDYKAGPLLEAMSGARTVSDTWSRKRCASLDGSIAPSIMPVSRAVLSC